MSVTTKTLTPTNQTVTLPGMDERPNASVLTDGIGKEADAINALSDHIENLNKWYNADSDSSVTSNRTDAMKYVITQNSGVKFFSASIRYTGGFRYAYTFIYDAYYQKYYILEFGIDTKALNVYEGNSSSVALSHSFA